MAAIGVSPIHIKSAVEGISQWQKTDENSLCFTFSLPGYCFQPQFSFYFWQQVPIVLLY